MGGGKSASKRAAAEAARARQEEESRQGRVTRGTANVNRIFDRNFDDSYYSGLADSYMDYANPQLVDQHTDANKQLIFDLARGGNLDSSTRATKAADLQEIYDRGQQQIADKALGMQNDARNSVEDARAALISQVNATGDATGATNAARNRAAALSQPAGAYDTLTNMFADFTGALGQRYAQERAYAASNGQSAGYTPVTYGSRTGSVKVSG